MTASIPRRLTAIKRLAKEYCLLRYGVAIENYTELLRVFTIRGSSYPNHPHKMMRVYISRKSLKHFVESCTYELLKNHTPEHILESICFAIDHIQETITDYDVYIDEQPTNHFYMKDYSSVGRQYLRVLLEVKAGVLEIKSIHFRKVKRK